MNFYLHKDLKPYFSNRESLFDQVMALRGETFRHQEGRRTQRITLGGKHYFIKQHSGVGWKEIFKNLSQLRLPILSAKNEWQAIEKLAQLGVAVPKVVAYGSRGCNPAKRESFIVMEELTPIKSLEEIGKSWQVTPPTFTDKRKLMAEVAKIASLLHENGINHRDFYICHFLLDQASKSMKLYLIDLHRAAVRRSTPLRWIIKDLAGLYFSSKDLGLTQRDYYRFMCAYHHKTLREVLLTDGPFWQKVRTRGEQLYIDHQ